jgi:hypothetical protein
MRVVLAAIIVAALTLMTPLTETKTARAVDPPGLACIQIQKAHVRSSQTPGLEDSGGGAPGLSAILQETCRI